jgi:hypothetical protein
MSERAKPDLKWEDDEFVTLERYERLREALREIAPYAAGSPFAEKIIREALGDTPDE